MKYQAMKSKAPGHVTGGWWFRLHCPVICLMQAGVHKSPGRSGAVMVGMMVHARVLGVHIGAQYTRVNRF